jgi:hypothetical protein
MLAMTMTMGSSQGRVTSLKKQLCPSFSSHFLAVGTDSAADVSCFGLVVKPDLKKQQPIKQGLIDRWINGLID